MVPGESGHLSVLDLSPSSKPFVVFTVSGPDDCVAVTLTTEVGNVLGEEDNVGSENKE